MEIISFVQDKPAVRKFNLPLFSKSGRERSESSYFRMGAFSPAGRNMRRREIYPTELKTFAVKAVSGPFNLRIFLMETGRAVSEFIQLLFENSFSIFKVLLAVLLLVMMIIGGQRAYNYFNNFTGPLSIQKTDEISIEKLNQLMSDFALEVQQEIDESGKIAEAAIPLRSNYTSPVTYQTYKVQSGDTIGGIARKFKLSNVSTLISVNDISNVRQLCAGQKLKIPSIDGIIYTVKGGDSINSIVEKNKISLKQLLDVNDLSSEVLHAGQQLFLPGASLDQKTLKTAMGDRFIMPISARFRWSSPYGWREDPIAHVKSFHTGTDMACPTGTPILASMSGKVITTGINRVYGNYVIIDHGNGYQTLYAHMSKIIASKGQWVSQGTRIGLVGSTGYSTGPHLHFTVYKNGKMVNPMSVLK
ncbi:metalloendopeptidase-like membrane protein [Treponema sp. JC4]|uniref:peptidoglycan DD-metalloendopeptidase family protein n=1 Tax=Treponema sp. JC4 TaxID=1124982 RepID=UPI00025AFD76|nr:M23 family metallopeptidase [Treponema sp. JC4]EID84831.1 metalloendopeptidase-like membrane protein [Treponema sp. JC4]